MYQAYGSLANKETGIFLLHGGAGPRDPKGADYLEACKIIKEIARQVHTKLWPKSSALKLVQYALECLEEAECFNAGRGSALQADGLARLSASVMDGKRQSFSGVINASYLHYPSRLALKLQERSSRVLSPPGVELLARELGEKLASPLIEKRIDRWVERFKQSGTAMDTVGCVALGPQGELAAGSSTGGRGFEWPGRVTDSATVAGNYASQFAAITATGIGEEIVDDALAARMETRIRDGLSLQAASELCFKEASQKIRSYGWIACDAQGHWGVAYTSKAMSFIVMDGAGQILHESQLG